VPGSAWRLATNVGSKICIYSMKLTSLCSRLPRTAPRMTVLALHAGLSTDEQLRVFQPAERGHRKVIVATNIAEVSAGCSQ
jgi:HrpA-like RNA helicase